MYGHAKCWLVQKYHYIMARSYPRPNRGLRNYFGWKSATVMCWYRERETYRKSLVFLHILLALVAWFKSDFDMRGGGCIFGWSAGCRWRLSFSWLTPGWPVGLGSEALPAKDWRPGTFIQWWLTGGQSRGTAQHNWEMGAKLFSKLPYRLNWKIYWLQHQMESHYHLESASVTMV